MTCQLLYKSIFPCRLLRKAHFLGRQPPLIDPMWTRTMIWIQPVFVGNTHVEKLCAWKIRIFYNSQIDITANKKTSQQEYSQNLKAGITASKLPVLTLTMSATASNWEVPLPWRAMHSHRSVAPRPYPVRLTGLPQRMEVKPETLKSSSFGLEDIFGIDGSRNPHLLVWTTPNKYATPT